jgi:poly(A) polymerase/tRNA nucleotidyltransferase (CCA-adding enzyme)
MSKGGTKIEYCIPNEVVVVANTLQNNNFEAYLIGGCTRDLILGRKPKDWDITTNAKPEQIQALFSDTFYENDYGTVGIVNRETLDSTLQYVEVTPYRLESNYSDNRRPDSVTFSETLEEDLKRRDFTINAIALKIDRETSVAGTYETSLIDLYGGIQDLKNSLLRAVGNPLDRFNEDALRIMRAVRLSAELNFTIDNETEKGIIETSHLLSKIAKERIREEFTKMIMSSAPMYGMQICQKYGLIPHILPEIGKAIGVAQNKSHIYDVWEHSIRALQHGADKGFSLEVRLAALLHDIAKPHTKRSEGQEATFYGHEVLGARLAEKSLTELRYSKKIIEKVTKLVRWHMFFADTEQISHSAVRRIVAKVGQENVWDLMKVRACDRIGMGRPKEDPYRLRKYEAMIEEVMRDPISVGMLKIDGKRLIDITKMLPGPKIGYILHALLEEVLDKPELNTSEYLESQAIELSRLPEKKLREIGEEGKQKKEDEDEKVVKQIRKEHKVV